MTHTFVERCVDYEVAPLSVLMAGLKTAKMEINSYLKACTGGVVKPGLATLRVEGNMNPCVY